MTQTEFNTFVAASERPTIIDVWAPWCGPCKAMKPIFDSLADEYGDKATVVAVNAKENPDVVTGLRVYAIPTVLVFRGGREVARRKGAQSETDLRALFDAVVGGREIPRLSNRTRYLRIAAAVLAAAIAGRFDPVWPMQLLAVGLFLSAIHDRCPIIQGIRNSLASRSVTGRTGAAPDA